MEIKEVNGTALKADDHANLNYSGNFTMLGADNDSSGLKALYETVSVRPKDPLISLTVPAIMFASGVLGNVLALAVLARSSRETKQRAFYRLVGALACTDLLGTCATSPVTLAVYANNLKWIGGTPLCNYESFMLIFAGCATISIICAMAVDRFFSICKPFTYDKYVTSRRIKVTLLGLWGFAMVMGCLPVIGLGENVIQFPGTWCFFSFTSSKIKNQFYTYLYASIGLIGIIVTGMSNLFVTAMLLKMKRRARLTMSVCYTCTRRQSKETQMLILMVGIIAIFSTCWGPFLIRIIVNQVNMSQVDVKADLFALRLASLNQILDPWIYILFRKGLITTGKKYIRSIFHTFCHEPDELSKGCKLSDKKWNKYDLSSENVVSYSSEDHDTIGNHSNSMSDDVKFKNNSSSISGESLKYIQNSRSSISEECKFIQSRRGSSRRSSRKSLKSLRRSRGSMMVEQLQLINGHTVDCPGLKHVSCLYCFTSLPQNFALILGSTIDDTNIDHVNESHVETIAETPEEVGDDATTEMNLFNGDLNHVGEKKQENGNLNFELRPLLRGDCYSEIKTTGCNDTEQGVDIDIDAEQQHFISTYYKETGCGCEGTSDTGQQEDCNCNLDIDTNQATFKLNCVTKKPECLSSDDHMQHIQNNSSSNATLPVTAKQEQYDISEPPSEHSNNQILSDQRFSNLKIDQIAELSSQTCTSQTDSDNKTTST